MTEWTLKDGERLDDLVRDGMRLIQRPDQFCFSVDSVLLAHYVKPKAKDPRDGDRRHLSPRIGAGRKGYHGL